MTTLAEEQAAGLALLTASMLGSGKYSDLTIKCHELVFNVHRNVVCLQSDVLAAMTDGPFKEASTGIIDLEDDDPNVVKEMVEFFYYQDYTTTTSPTNDDVSILKAKKQSPDLSLENQKEYRDFDTEENSPSGKKKLKKSKAVVAQAFDTVTHPKDERLLLIAQVYVAGDKYNIPALKTLSRIKYEAAVVNNWNSTLFVASLALVYDHTPESDRLLKDVALRAVAKNIKSLLDRGEFVELCKTHPEISFDVLNAHLNLQPEKPRCTHCEYHNPNWISWVKNSSTYRYCDNCGNEFYY